MADPQQAFFGSGTVLGMQAVTAEELRAAVAEATPLLPQGPLDNWLSGISRLADGSVAVAGALLELLWLGAKKDVWNDISPRPIQDPDAAFLALLDLNAERIRQQVRLLRTLDPAALPVAIAVARGQPPYAAVQYSADASRALRALRRAGFAIQRAPRRWSLTDPLLAGWLRRPASAGTGTPSTRVTLSS